MLRKRKTSWVRYILQFQIIFSEGKVEGKRVRKKGLGMFTVIRKEMKEYARTEKNEHHSQVKPVKREIH